MNPLIIQVNEEGRKAIQALCDIALKAGGVQNLSAINIILGSVRLIPPQVTKPEEPKPTEVPIPNKIRKKLGGEDKPCSAA